MVKFIIYDDQTEAFQRTANIINRSMIKDECDYRIEKFTKYDINLERLIKTDTCQKIYLIDIEVPDVNGISLATKIRKYDWNSIIIFITAYEKYRLSVYEERLMILDFVCKKKNYSEKLGDSIQTALKALDKNKRTLKYRFNSITYRIPMNEILYIVKVPLNKKCTIVTTTNARYEIAGSIAYLSKTLGRQFKQSHKSCIVNVENVKIVDTCSNVITFKDGTSTNLLSSRMRKEFEEYVINYEA